MNTSRPRRFLIAIALGIMLGSMSTVTAMAAVPPDDDPGSPVFLSNAALASTLFEVVFNGDVAPGALVSDNAVIHTPYGDFTGPQGLQDYLGIIRRAYPDAAFHVSSIEVRDDTVTVRWTMTATRFQIDPTEPVINVQVSNPGETTITIADGQVAELNQAERGTAVQSAEEIAVNHAPSE